MESFWGLVLEGLRLMVYVKKNIFLGVFIKMILKNKKAPFYYKGFAECYENADKTWKLNPY